MTKIGSLQFDTINPHSKMKTKIELFHNLYPMCQVIKTSDDEYVMYDAKANFAFAVDEKEADTILSILIDRVENKTDSDKLDDSPLSRQLKKLLEAGVFIPGEAESVSSEDREIVSKQIEYWDANVLPRKFVLEATEECNYRCKYCPNTIHEGTGLRSHTHRKMSFETAKRAIDYYFSKYTAFYVRLSEEKKKLLEETIPPTLAWYGGEPLMNFTLQKHAMEYFKSKPWDEFGIDKKYLSFSTNSNMSAMTDDMLHYLVDNNVQLFASLDGPKSENDKCRVFVNGQGTFDTIVKNLKKIKEYAPEYFKEKVVIYAVEATCYDHEKCIDYFENGDFAGDNILYQTQEPIGCIIEHPEEDYENLCANFDERLNFLKDMIDKADTDHFPEKLEEFINFVKIKNDNPKGSNNLGLTLSCPMGIDNNIVGVNGDIHICHKTDGSAPFGNIYSLPIDYSKLVDIYLDHNRSVNEGGCKSCWIVNFCPICGARRLNSGKMNNPTPAECKVIRLEEKLMLMAYFYASQHRPDLVEYIAKKRVNKREYVSVTDVNTY